METRSFDAFIITTFMRMVGRIEDAIDRDLVMIDGPIFDPVARSFDTALKALGDERRKCVTVLIDTPGGSAETAERMAESLRHFYSHVEFLVLGSAMSAGTILAMSGDTIRMDEFGRLGPIDPQLVKADGSIVPVQSYIAEYERLIQKSADGTLTDAEFALLSRFDLGELHRFGQATELSISLLKTWLKTYKFKDWTTTESRKKTVTPAMKTRRANDIAKKLANNGHWHSHARGLSRDVLRDELKLRIEPLEDLDATVVRDLAELHTGVVEYTQRMSIPFLTFTRQGYR